MWRARVRNNVHGGVFRNTRKSTVSSNWIGSLISNRRYQPTRNDVDHSRIFQRFSSIPSLVEENIEVDPVESAEISIEKQYTRTTPVQHVLLRPGMYVGSNERAPPSPSWILEEPPEDPTPELLTLSTESPSRLSSLVNGTMDLKLVKKNTGLAPALIKIFDEILVNASDNRLRNPNTCSRIDVILDRGSATRSPLIFVYNDGKGIPVHMHQDEKMYVPQMVFGNLLTGSNFDDSEERLTGGRHGYGAKLANIFSKTFTVETVDSKRKMKYRQTWSNNMHDVSNPEITKSNRNANDYTCVSFVPDLSRLTSTPGATTISDDDYAFMCRRVLDIAGCTAGQMEVTLNGKIVTQSSFPDFSQLYRKNDSLPLRFTSVGSRWKIGVGLSESGSFESVSFVNGMSTSRGGNHINVIAQQLAKELEEFMVQNHPEIAEELSQSLIRRHLFISCNAQIVNPSFDSQMKEYLTSSPASFGSSCGLSSKFIKELLKTVENGGPGIVEEVLTSARGRQQASLFKVMGKKKTKRQLLSIPKLDDAHDAGSSNGKNCTLILTEGDSAKALAIAGLEVIGRKTFGVFPLRGKLLNVKQAPLTQLRKNVEIKSLCEIIGLDFKKEYATTEERNELRYGHVMLMTDQDTDGSHIKGLVINFLRHFWPKLLEPASDRQEENGTTNSFISSFVTPLLKAFKKDSKTSLSFYSAAEFNEWSDKLSPDELKKWNIKYYKGLGTSTPTEAKEYFKAFDYHVRPFHWKSESDGECLDMVFDKKRASDRRDWINDIYDPTASNGLNTSGDNGLTYEDFINKEFIHFSHADNIRSIPSVIDGLKPSQRKVLHACFKRKLDTEIKVAQLSGYCAEKTAYHHGEVSLQSTIIGMAQDFVGSNNINLLVPSGQFGTRLMGGSDAASPRYIFTRLSPITRCLFPEDDDVLLQYREEEGQIIEPDFFYPIIPLLLVNGSQGIGTGWSTFIPPYNPIDLVEYIHSKLDNTTSVKKLVPYAKNFNGKIEVNSNDDGFYTYGLASVVNGRSIRIDELPLRMWTNDYKERLLTMRDNSLLSSFVENHTTTKVSFTVTLKEDQQRQIVESGLEKAFGLKTHLKTTNMYAFDAQKKLKKFDRAEDIIEEFFPVRMELYHHRKSVMESEMRHASVLQQNKARFIELIQAGQINLLTGKASKKDMIMQLDELGFHSSEKLEAIRNNNTFFLARKAISSNLLPSEQEERDEGVDLLYDYLLNMPLSSLTSERIDALKIEASRKEKELQKIISMRASDLWRADLKRLSKHLS